MTDKGRERRQNMQIEKLTQNVTDKGRERRRREGKERERTQRRQE